MWSAEVLSAKFQEALSLHQRGVFAQARTLYDEILRHQPHHFDALHLSGVIEAQQRNYPKALELMRQAVAVDAGSAVAHYNMASVLRELRQLEAALRSYDIVIELQPNHARAYFNRARILYEMGRLEEALASYDGAIRHQPAFADAYCNRGIVLGALRRIDSSIASYDRAIEINPKDAVACFNRGLALRELNRLEAARASYDQAIALRADFPEAYYSRGVVLKELSQFESALADYDRAQALNPNFAEPYCGRGNVLAALGQVAAAIEQFDRAIALKAEFSTAHFCRATTLLLGGDFERGWPAYEWRWQKLRNDGIAVDLVRQTKPWLGQESIAGRTVLLSAEQGLGDTLQFCRYATLVAASGARVILEAPQSLRRLMASVEGVSQVVAPGDAIPDFDHHCPLMSLPLAFKTTLATVPAPLRYLRSPPDRVQFWQERLGAGHRKLRVGLVWSGGFRADRPDLWPTNDRRNIPLALLAPLRHPDVEFFSLQVGQPAASEPARLHAEKWDGPDIIDHTDLLQDFAETAALIDNLDLVIAVDTSTAHLAGALGKPVWILNRFDTCWRWLLNRETSPWYPSARLYRQEALGDWNGVIRRVRADLLRLIS